MTTAVAERIPRPLLLGAGALVAIAFIAAGLGRLNGPAPLVASSPIVASIDLFFEDRPDGSVSVLRAPTLDEIVRAEPGTNGFLRSTMRGLARERRANALGPEVPFRLTQWSDGRLTLDDPTTGRRVELEAFGATNAAAFARLLPSGAQPVRLAAP